jgi:hypothetical protein
VGAVRRLFRLRSLALGALASGALALQSCSTTPPPARLASARQSLALPTASASLGGMAWYSNPAIQQISAYKVYRVTGGSAHLEGTVTTPIFRPDRKGTFYVTALNVRGESPPSTTIKL